MLKYFQTATMLSLFLLASCVKEDDVFVPETVQPDPDAGVHVQDFMWKAMNFWYFWQADVDNLADNKFSNTPEGSELYTTFLDSEEGPAEFFENKLRIKNNSSNKFIVKKFIFSSNDIKNTIKIEKKYN